MAEIWNPGSDIIEAFLKGVAVKNQREANVQRAQHQFEMQKLADAKMKEQSRQFEDRLRETKDYHTGQMDLNKKKFDQTLKLFKYQIAEGLQKGTIRLADNEDGFEFTEPGTQQKVATQAKVDEKRALIAPTVEEAQALLPTHVQEAREKSMAELPARTNLAMIQSELSGAAQKAQRDWQTIENQKNRDSALARANLVLEGRLNATKAEKDDLVQQTVDSHEPEVLTGRMTFEDMNKVMSANTRAATQNELRKREIVPLHDTQREDLKLLPMAQNFYGKLKELNEIINSHPDPRTAELDPKYVAKMAEVQQDLDAWGRAVKGFKGMITERDTQRLIGGIPKSWAAGLRSIMAGKKDLRTINQERLDKIEDFIQEKFDLITRGSSSKQTSAVREQYGINPLSERQFRARYKKAK